MGVSHLFRNKDYNKGGPGKTFRKPRNLQYFLSLSPGPIHTTQQTGNRHIYIYIYIYGGFSFVS